MENYVNGYFIKLQQIALQYIMLNYDYCYLDAMHEKNRKTGARTIIAGSSHAMNGVAESEFSEETINFSISSQDLYFDFLNIKKAVEEGRQQIKRCVINIGYYMLYQDLSLSKTMGYLMDSVYRPLFQDTHNYPNNTVKNIWAEFKQYEDLYSMELIRQICTEFARGYFERESSFYGSLKAREENNLLTVNGIIWQKLSDEEKHIYAQKRAADHNRLKKHTASREENGKIIESMTWYLHEKGIKTVFVIFPFTRFYNLYIDQDYKRDIYSLLDSLVCAVDFLDMNDYQDMFEEEDYLDTDHLNLEGAKKASRLLNEFLNVFVKE